MNFLKSLCLRGHRGGHMVTVGSMFALASATASASVTNNWINWTAPASYPESASWIQGGNTYHYDYATELLGTMTMPDASTVYVKLTGEIAQSPGSSSAWSRFGQSGTSYWSGSSYTSANVTSTPNDDRIGLAGFSPAVTQTLTFYSDAARTTLASIENIVLLVDSLGAPSAVGEWDFTQDFDILSGNGNLSKANPSSGTYRLSGYEGDGAVQFLGTFSSFSWTVNYPEAIAYWTLGSTSAAAPSAVPGAGVAGLATAGLAGTTRRRRRR